MTEIEEYTPTAKINNRWVRMRYNGIDWIYESTNVIPDNSKWIEASESEISEFNTIRCEAEGWITKYEREKLKHEYNCNVESNIKCDLIQLVHQQGLKVYHCEDSICITKSCEKGRELKDLTGGTQQYAEIYDGYCREWIPTYREPLTLYYVDGEITIIKEISIKKGCEHSAEN